MKLYKWLIGAMLLGASLQIFAFDYKLGGRAEAFSKIGFSNGKYNVLADKYPTDSYGTLFGTLELTALWESGIKVSIGGALNSLVYDSTRRQGGQSLGHNYIGAWFGYYGDKDMLPYSRGYILHNAYVSYEGEHFGFKAGRYESDGLDWFGAWNQGAEAYVRFSGVKLWGFFSDARAMVYNNWFWDFTRFSIAGKQLFAGGLAYEKNGFGIEGYMYFVPSRVSAPGFKLRYDSNPNFNGNGFRSQTTFIALFPQNATNPHYNNGNPIESDTLFGIAFNADTSRKTQTLFVKQQFDIDSHRFGAMIYKNFGNANAWIGSYGDPFGGLDIWTGSVYDTGRSLSDIVGRNALSGMGFVGGHYGGFDWEVLGRLTTSPRSDEQSLALILEQEIFENLSARLKLEYFNDTTKAGYSIGGDTPILTKNQRTDRSHAMVWLLHKF